MSLIGGTTGGWGVGGGLYSRRCVCVCVERECVSGHLLCLKFTLKECELLLLEGSNIVPIGIYK